MKIKYRKISKFCSINRYLYDELVFYQKNKKNFRIYKSHKPINIYSLKEDNEKDESEERVYIK